MDGKGKAIQVRQKIKVNGALTDALPYNTVDEVYVDPDSNTMLREKLLNIDNTIKTTSAENTKLTGTIVTVETKISDIESNIGSGGNISQEISTIKTEIEEVKQKLNTSYTSALENENRLNVLVNKHQNHKNNKITNLNGVHGVRYVNDVLSYRDNDMNWHEVKSGGDELELIKQALSGKISKNQFVKRRVNCTVTGGCYKNGKYFINTPILEEVPPTSFIPRVMTVKINLLESDPLLAVTYHDDAVNMKPGSIEWDIFFGHYPCLFKDGQEIGNLKRSDFSFFENGSEADITSGNAGDVMIAYPRRGLRMVTENNILTVSMTNKPDDPDFTYYNHTRGTERKEKFYFGAYEGVIINGEVRSLSGYTPTRSTTITAYRAAAQKKGVGYQQKLVHQFNYLAAMYLLKYKNRNSQIVIGKGHTNNAHTAPLATGTTNTKGMDWGDINSTNSSMKLFGVENLWGNISEWTDGARLNSTKNLMIATSNYGTIGSYELQGIINQLNGTGYVSSVVGTNKGGFVLKELKGYSNSYFCDVGFALTDTVCHTGGSYRDGTYCGIFHCSFFDGETTTSDKIGGRLTYV